MAAVREVDPRQRPSEMSKSGSDDYLTPRWVFDALALRFDLDVCAPADGGLCPADAWYTLEDDGLAQPWHGRIWMNPPFSNVAPWADRFIAHGHGIALVPCNGSRWYPRLWNAADEIALPREANFRFIGGTISRPVWFAAFGPECVDALARVGTVRV
jgi:phage N-6-adenine-methyltransferase